MDCDVPHWVSLLVVSRRGVDTRRCASKDAGRQREVDLGAVPHRYDVTKGVDCDVLHWASLLVVLRRGVDTRRCASKDAGPQREVDLGVVPHRYDVSAFSLFPEGG